MPINAQQLAELNKKGTLSMEERDRVVLMKKKSGFPCETRVSSVNKMIARGSKIVDATPKAKK